MKPPSGLVLTFYGIANTNDTNRPDAATGSSLLVAVNADISHGEEPALSASISVR